MWTYLVCGAVPAAGGLVYALTPGWCSNGVIALAIGLVNLGVGATHLASPTTRSAASPVHGRHHAQRPVGSPWGAHRPAGTR